MNYIWDTLLKADSQKIDREKLVFKHPISYSPYMEVSFENLNETKIQEDYTVEVNPYYRFLNIFKDFFHIEYDESTEFRESLFDILMHFLGFIDLKQGLYKWEYYKKFIKADILNGMVSDKVKENFSIFTDYERDIVLSNILSLYKTNVSLELFKKVVKGIFKKSIVYLNNDNKKEILVVIGEEKTKTAKSKIDLLIDMFLDIKFDVFLYWKYHFGVIGIEDTMTLEEMVIY
ncbi:hypothetical protein [Dethiothermospora halolimnae]|uniref:hypothetical protein n=1 Tax=Dethiothermospora halolimnae TaxID=3114390 RepID=UPI003CCBFFB4